jgi:uncharacterized protein YhaN
MPSTSLLSRAKPGLTADALAARRQEAEHTLRGAEAEYGRAALAFAEQQPGASKALATAQDAVMAARSAIQALDAAALQIEAANRERASDAARQAREKINAKTRAVAKARTEAARRLSEALRAYVAAYDTWREANDSMAAIMASASHLRDVFGTPASEAASLELARLSGYRPISTMPPGAHRGIALLDDPRTVRPLVEACEDEATAIFTS